MKYLYLTLLLSFVSCCSYAQIGPINGAANVCVGATLTLTDTSAGGIWSTGDATISIAGTGDTAVITGVSAGLASVTYTIGGSYVTSMFSVNPLPQRHSLYSEGGYCAGGVGAPIVIDTPDAGYSYQLLYSGSAIGTPISTSGTPFSFGIFTVPGVYSVKATNLVSGCQQLMLNSIAVSIIPTPPTPVLTIGSGSPCTGGPGTDLRIASSVPGAFYQLYIGSTPIGSAIPGTGGYVDFGAAPMSGTYGATATDMATGCTSGAAGISLSLLPHPGYIIGATGVCTGATTTLSDTTTGTWSSGNPAIATIGALSGIVTGTGVGSAAITFTSTVGCTVTTTVSVTSTLPPSSGPSTVCAGSYISITDTATGGVWNSSNTAVATVGSATGSVLGVAAGTANISYTIGGSCGLVTHTVTVLPTPATITGVSSVCNGDPTTLYDATPGGVWGSLDTGVATINPSTGAAVSLSPGLAHILYTSGACSAHTIITVDPRPVVTGANIVCVYDTIMLGTSIYGTWTTSDPGIATVDYYGRVTGVTPGAAVITSNAYSTGCATSHPVTVHTTCSGMPVAGIAHLGSPTNCSGNQNKLYLTGYSNICGTGFQWQSSIDSLTWSDVPGATFDSVAVNPEANLYYRCLVKCYSSGMSSYSTLVHVGIYNTITSHGTLNTPSYFCNGPGFLLTTCGIAPGTNVLTYYGDGSHDSVHLFSYSYDSTTTDTILHAYQLSGAYTVKQVLRDGLTRQDSITFSYNYTYCRTLPISFYFDTNGDSVLDAGDGYLYRPITTEVDSNGISIDTITAISGFYYKALGDSGTVYTFRVLSFDTSLHMWSPASGILYDTINAFVNNYPTKYFGFYCSSTTNFNLAIHADMNCGRHWAWGCINVQNTYCTPESTVIVMNFSPKYIFANSSPAPYSVVGNTVTWHMPPVSVYAAYDQWPNIWYNLTIPGLWLVTGDTVNSNYKVNPYTGDVDTTNNYLARVDTIISSYDPNLMTVSPAGNIIPCTKLEYTIDFENTGNDTAHNIYVMDTLSDNIDPHSIKVVSATAVMNITIIKDGPHSIVKFDFPNINLLDSSHYNLCNGQVRFTAMAKTGLPDGATIYNHAGIFFDDNPVVMTDTAINTIGISPINGPSVVCNTQSIRLSDASAGGTWTSGIATTVAGGLVTGISAGTSLITYTIANTCASRSVTKLVTVNPAVTPAVSVSASPTAHDSICEGTTVSFAPTPTNGGTYPTYEWVINGTLIGVGSAYSYTPANGDIVATKLTSSATCALPDTAVGSVTMTVLPYASPSVTIGASAGTHISVGLSDTLVAVATGAGTAPYYQWYINGNPVPGATNQTFIYDHYFNDDVVSCEVTANGMCATSSSSNTITVTLYNNTGINGLDAKQGISIFPNPNNGAFTIRGSVGLETEEVSIEITDMLGQLVYRNKLVASGGNINEPIALSNTFTDSIYILRIHSESGNRVVHFVVGK